MINVLDLVHTLLHQLQLCRPFPRPVLHILQRKGVHARALECSAQRPQLRLGLLSLGPRLPELRRCGPQFTLGLRDLIGDRYSSTRNKEVLSAHTFYSHDWKGP